MIDIKNITKTYSQGSENEFQALKGVTFQINDGEFVAIMGPSGSGKSTLMHILGCLDTPTSGSYFLGGHDVSKLSDDELAEIRRDTIGFVFQSFNLLPRTTVLRNVTLPLVYGNIPEDERERRAKDSLISAGLDPSHFMHKSNQLSGGQIQRVAIARALVNNPIMILADEPTGNLDTRTGEIVLGTFQRLNTTLGRTIVLITHEPDVAEHADRIITIRDGVIVSDEKNLKKNYFTSMTIYDIFHETYGALTANKVRTGLTMLGIIIGISSVIAMTAIGTGAQNSIQSSIQSIGSNLVMVTPGAQRTFGKPSGARGSAQTLTVLDGQAIQSTLSNISGIAFNVTSREQVVIKGANTNTSIVGTTPSYTTVRSLTMNEGTFFNESNVSESSRVAVIGPTVVTDLFSDGSDPVGQMIRINGTSFKIIGVTVAKGGSGFSNVDDTIYIPYSTAQHYLSGNQYLSEIDVSAASADVTSQVQSDITTLLMSRHHITDASKVDFSTLNQADIIKTASGVTSTFTTLLAAVAGISLLVGGIGIMNMMLTTVTERTREIGLRKAIGAKASDISIQFLIESVMMTFIGGIIGIILGWSIAFTVTYLGILQTSVSLGSIFLAFGVSTLIGIVFGYYPAKRAAGLNPIEALRYE